MSIAWLARRMQAGLRSAGLTALFGSWTSHPAENSVVSFAISAIRWHKAWRSKESYLARGKNGLSPGRGIVRFAGGKWPRVRSCGGTKCQVLYRVTSYCPLMVKGSPSTRATPKANLNCDCWTWQRERVCTAFSVLTPTARSLAVHFRRTARSSRLHTILQSSPKTKSSAGIWRQERNFASSRCLAVVHTAPVLARWPDPRDRIVPDDFLVGFHVGKTTSSDRPARRQHLTVRFHQGWSHARLSRAREPGSTVNPLTGKELLVKNAAARAVMAVAWSPSGRQLALASGECVSIHDVPRAARCAAEEPGIEDFHLEGCGDYVRAPAFLGMASCSFRQPITAGSTSEH